MNNAVAATLAAAMILAGSDAIAHASATAQIGDVSVSQDGSGPNFAITEWDVSLGTGESVSQTFSWSVTLHTDGLPATRTWDDGTVFGCLPLYEMKCGPAATGSELIEVFLQSYRDGRAANPFIDFTDTFANDILYDSVGTQTLSGSFTLTATNTGIGPQSDGIGLFAALWVDSAAATPPVPEPAGIALGIAGLATVLAALRRRGRRPVQLAA